MILMHRKRKLLEMLAEKFSCHFLHRLFSRGVLFSYQIQAIQWSFSVRLGLTVEMFISFFVDRMDSWKTKSIEGLLGLEIVLPSAASVIWWCCFKLLRRRSVCVCACLFSSVCMCSSFFSLPWAQSSSRGQSFDCLSSFSSPSSSLLPSPNFTFPSFLSCLRFSASVDISFSLQKPARTVVYFLLFFRVCVLLSHPSYRRFLLRVLDPAHPFHSYKHTHVPVDSSPCCSLKLIQVRSCHRWLIVYIDLFIYSRTQTIV